MTPPRLSAIDALARGFANVRANRELIAVQVVSGLLLAASIVVPVLFFLVRLGVPLRVFTVRERRCSPISRSSPRCSVSGCW